MAMIMSIIETAMLQMDTTMEVTDSAMTTKDAPKVDMDAAMSLRC